jgi:flagellin-like hook-associated protein FlgL
MTQPLRVDLDHLRRSGARMMEHGRDLSDLADRLRTETAAGPRWIGEHGGEAFTGTFAELAVAALTKLEQLADDLDVLGTNLGIMATELDAAEERTAATVEAVREGL